MCISGEKHRWKERTRDENKEKKRTLYIILLSRARTHKYTTHGRVCGARSRGKCARLLRRYGR